MLPFVKQIWITKDVASAVLLAAIIAVSLWILALPFCSGVQEAYLKRFHLATPNFLSWAAQQTVPSMYNLENRYWFSRERLTVGESFENTNDHAFPGRNFNDRETGMVNHFPTRKFTFGDARSILNEDPNGYFYLSSKYRGREIRSSFQMRPVSDTEIQFKQLEWTLE